MRVQRALLVLLVLQAQQAPLPHKMANVSLARFARLPPKRAMLWVRAAPLA
jgi:hypothetical protein